MKETYLPQYTDYDLQIKPLPEPDEVEVKEFPYTHTPSVLADWIKDNAEIKSMPSDYIATGLLVCLSSLIAGKVKVQPIKTDSTYAEVPNLWGCIIGRPSAMKTPALNLSLDFMRKFESLLDKEYEEDLETHKLIEKINKQEEKELEKDIAKKIKDKAGMMNTDSLIEEFRSRGKKLEEPQAKRLVVNDVTPEKLAEMCSYNPNGILTVRDELVGLLNDLNRPDRPNAKALYLEGWNGTNQFKTDRIGRGSQVIERLLLSVLGTTQPGVLNKYIREARDKEGGDGLLQRFQFLVYPKLSKQEGLTRQPDFKLKDKVEKIFDDFFNYEPNEFDVVTFDEQGQEWFDLYKKENFRLTRSGKLNPILEAHLGKYTKLYSALALIFALVENINTLKINEEASLNAFVWVQYLESHARSVYGLVDDPFWNAKELLKRMETLFDWRLVPGEKEFITSREVHRKQWSHLKQIEDVVRALDQLTDHGYFLKISTTPSEKGGRPTDRYYPHPDLVEHFITEAIVAPKQYG